MMNEELERKAFHKEVKELLNYNPDTGVFTWLKPSSNLSRVKIGSIAGSVDASRGYRKIRVKCKRYAAHRLAWFYVHGEWPDVIDHINGERDDNRMINLRDVSQFINTQNMSRNKSGCAGVTKNPKDNYWYARLNTGGVNQFLGCFKRYEDACIAARRARIDQFGECLDMGEVVKSSEASKSKQESNDE